MIIYLREILYLIDKDTKKIPFLLLLFLISSTLDLLSLGLVGPYVGLVVDPNLISGKGEVIIQVYELDEPKNQKSLTFTVEAKKR